MYILFMAEYTGIKFVCNSSGNFELINKDWKYKNNVVTSLVRVSEVGICNSDFSRLFLGTGHKYPITIGHEIVGSLESAEGELSESLGQNICIFPLLPCHKCQYCVNQQFNLCGNYSYLGSREDGGLSSFIEVPNWNILIIKDKIKSNYLPLIEPASVIFHAFKPFARKDLKLLITGSGFLSYLALKIGEYLKFAEIGILSTSKSNQNLFADYFVDEKLKQMSEYTACVDLSGNANVVESVTRILSPGSTIVTVANSRQDTLLTNYARENILRKELVFRGSWNSCFGGKRNDWLDAMHFLSQTSWLEYPTINIPLGDFPDYLQSKAFEFPKERIHVHV